MKVAYKGILLVMALTCSVTAIAQDNLDAKYLTIGKMKVRSVSRDILNQDVLEPVYERSLNQKSTSGLDQNGDPVERVGKVIAVARDIVALGEDIYKLVIKGKPTNATSYAPISVVPRVNNAAVDILDTEGWSMPVKRTYEVVYENLYGIDVVTFRYSIIYSYKGSYEGRGAYLTAVQIVPETVRTLFGFDFTATMKLGGIVNQGTKAEPIAGATLLMEYTVSSVMVAQNQVDTYFINGRGTFKKY